MCGLNIAHMIVQGGVDEMVAIVAKRSSILYDYIESSEGFYSNGINKEFRSKMKIPF